MEVKAGWVRLSHKLPVAKKGVLPTLRVPTYTEEEPREIEFEEL